MPELTDGVLRLRGHTEADLPGVVAQARDPESVRWTTVPVPYAEADAHTWALEVIPAGWRDGSSYSFAIEEVATGAFCGTVDVRPRDPGAAEVGYGLAPAARGRGLMTRALGLAADWAFAPVDLGGLGLEVLHWQAHVGNWASRRVAWRLGFRVEGAVRGLCGQRGELHDAWVGSLRRDDSRLPVNRWIEAPVLHGRGLVLRPWRESDASAVVEACTDPVSRRWLPELPEPYDEPVALEFVRSREGEHAEGRALHLAAAADEHGPAIGSFSVGGLDSRPGAAPGSGEIGYWMHPGARGSGVATEAVRLLVRHAFVPAADAGLGLRRLVVRAATGNRASQLVAERNGFVRVGRQRQALPRRDGEPDDLVYFDLLAHEHPVAG